MDSAQGYLLVGVLISFFGTLPLGPINLVVVKTTLDYSSRHGLEVAFAAAFVEIIQFLVAFLLGQFIVEFLESNKIVRLLIAAICIALAVYLVSRTSRQVLDNQRSAPHSFYLRGLTIAALNPQAIPFWVFAVAALSQYMPMDVTGTGLGMLLTGVFAGKLLALSGFVYASLYIKTHLRQSTVIVDHLLAFVLVVVGVSQLWKI